MNTRIFRLFFRHSIPMFLTLALLGICTITITTQFLKAEQEKDAMQNLSQIQNYFEIILEEMDSLNIMFSTNPDIVNHLKTIMESDSWSFQDTRDIRNIRNYISAPANARAYIDSIYIYQENDKRRILTSSSGVVNINNMIDKEWFNSYREKNPVKKIWSEAREIWPTSVNKGTEQVISIYRTIYNGFGKRTGVMVLNLLKKRLIYDNPARTLPYDKSLTIKNDIDEILISTRDSQNTARGKIITFSQESERFGWTFEMAVTYTELYRLSRKLTILTLCIALVSLIFGFIISFINDQKERQFVVRTMELLEQAKGEKLDMSRESKQENIFDYLTENILQTFLEQDYLKLRKETMEYRALQMQINPHFLFNTLETINWRAIKMLKGPNDVSKMISLMSKILKYAMSVNSNNCVSFSEEIIHTGFYLDIQKIRFPNRFQLNWEIEPELSDYQIPRLILQPLLENSFNHGFRNDNKILLIGIQAQLQEGNVKLSIFDNGMGMETPHQGELLIQKDEPLRSDHIGLSNVQKRLYLFFKSKIEIHLNTRPGEGTEIIFFLPLSLPSPTTKSQL